MYLGILYCIKKGSIVFLCCLYFNHVFSFSFYQIMLPKIKSIHCETNQFGGWKIARIIMLQENCIAQTVKYVLSQLPSSLSLILSLDIIY